MTDALTFREVVVPPEIRHWGVVRSFKPNRGDFRLLLNDKGNWMLFPKRRISAEDMQAIHEFIDAQTTAQKEKQP